MDGWMERGRGKEKEELGVCMCVGEGLHGGGGIWGKPVVCGWLAPSVTSHCLALQSYKARNADFTLYD